MIWKLFRCLLLAFAVVTAGGEAWAKNWNTSGQTNNRDGRTKKKSIDFSQYNEFRTMSFSIAGKEHFSLTAFNQGKGLFGFWGKGILFHNGSVCDWKSNITNEKTKTGSFRVTCPNGLTVDGTYTYIGRYNGSQGAGKSAAGDSISYKLGGYGSSNLGEVRAYYQNVFPSPFRGPMQAANSITSISDANLCKAATTAVSGRIEWKSSKNGLWPAKPYVVEAHRRDLTCDVGEASTTQIASKTNSTPTKNQKSPTESSYRAWLKEIPAGASKFRVKKWCVPPNETTLGGEPYVDSNSPTWNRCKTGSGPKGTAVSYEAVKNFYSRKGNQSKLCNRVKHFDSYADALATTKSGANRTAVTYFILANDIQLSCDGNNDLPDDMLTAQLTKKLEEERQLRLKLERKLKVQNEQLNSSVSIDAGNVTKGPGLPVISIASATSSGPQGTITGRVSDASGVAELQVDGRAVKLDSNGNFVANTFVPMGGASVSVQAFNLAGRSSSMSVRLERTSRRKAALSFARLNPLVRKVAKNEDALALIVGVANYSETPAAAVYADTDAHVFADYATQKLGVPAERVKTLVNDAADEKGMLLAVKRWLKRAAKNGKSDVYVFFAGHGLASDDGKQMYLLPYDGAPELLDDTAILRDRLFNDIASSNPRSVTVFFDTCYSGQTRGDDMLIASRPVRIKAAKKSIPDNFTLLTAAAGDQTAKPLEEAKHGMFSYFLMKGMEGDADANKDNKITAGELHQYVQQNVMQQSSGSQRPELQGDADRVLVRFQ